MIDIHILNISFVYEKWVLKIALNKSQKSHLFGHHNFSLLLWWFNRICSIIMKYIYFYRKSKLYSEHFQVKKSYFLTKTLHMEFSRMTNSLEKLDPEPSLLIFGLEIIISPLCTVKAKYQNISLPNILCFLGYRNTICCFDLNSWLLSLFLFVNITSIPIKI